MVEFVIQVKVIYVGFGKVDSEVFGQKVEVDFSRIKYEVCFQVDVFVYVFVLGFQVYFFFCDVVDQLYYLFEMEQL